MNEKKNQNQTKETERKYNEHKTIRIIERKTFKDKKYEKKK